MAGQYWVKKARDEAAGIPRPDPTLFDSWQNLMAKMKRKLGRVEGSVGEEPQSKVQKPSGITHESTHGGHSNPDAEAYHKTLEHDGGHNSKQALGIQSPPTTPYPGSISDLERLNDGSTSRELSKQKLVNLTKAVADMFMDEPIRDIVDLVGKDTFKQIEALKERLDSRARDVEEISMSYGPNYSIYHERAIPKLISGLKVTPWECADIPSRLPTLPRILEPKLRTAAFTHRGCGPGRFDDLNYERLEWVGDAYIQLIATLLISKTFPRLTPGKSSQLRETLVKNVTLETYAKQYKFENRAILPKDLRTGPNPIKDHEWTKIFGDIFEAYVAAVILSDPIGGVDRATVWLKQLWAMTIASEIKAKGNLPFDNYIDVDPLWCPGKGDKLDKYDKRKVSEVPYEDIRNPKEKLRAMIGGKGVVIDYRDAAPERKSEETKMPVFTVGCFLTGWGEKEKQLGFGKAPGKKEAGAKAAEMAMANKKLMKVYMDKKAIFDKQMKAEEEAEKAASEKHEAMEKQKAMEKQTAMETQEGRNGRDEFYD